MSYEVVWAEDGDMPTVANFGKPAPAGEWRGGVQCDQDGAPLEQVRQLVRGADPVAEVA